MKISVIQENIMQPDITPEEISSLWNHLKKIPQVEDLVIHLPDHYPSPKDLHPLIGDADVVFGIWIDSDIINEDFLMQHPNLKYIACLGHGYGAFDVAMTHRKGIVISNTIYGAQTIAEYAFSLLMEICHNITFHSQILKTTNWDLPENSPLYCKTLMPQIELYGKTCGVIGLGEIGFAFAKMAAGFGMKVISFNRHKKTGPSYDFIEQVSLDEVLARSDVISLHVPFSNSSANMIQRENIAKMKDGVILLNTARGGLIVEKDLAWALRSGKIYAAGLDVLVDEPCHPDNPLLSCPNAYITGHIAWLTRASRMRAVTYAIDNFKSYLAGKPVSIIN